MKTLTNIKNNRTLSLLIKVMLFLAILFPNYIYAQLNTNNHELIINAYLQYNQHQMVIDYVGILDIEQLKDKNTFLEAKARSLYALNEIQKATNLFLALNKQNEKIVNYELAQCYGQLNKPIFATKYLEQHLTSNNKQLISTIKTDEAFNAIKESDEWIALWSKDWYSKTELLFADANYEYRLKNYDEAQEILDLIIDKRKTMHQAFQLKASIFADNKDYQNALYYITQACKIRPKYANYQYQKADYEYALGKANKALKSLNLAFSRDSMQIDFYTLQSQINMVLKNEDAALETIEQVNEIIDYEPVKYIAAQLCYEAGDYLNTLKYVNECIKGSNNLIEYYMLRAKTYFQSGVYAYAEKDFSFLLDYQPQNGELYGYRGLCRQKQGNIKGACSDWHKARGYKYIVVDEYLEKYCH